MSGTSIRRGPGNLWKLEEMIWRSANRSTSDHRAVTTLMKTFGEKMKFDRINSRGSESWGEGFVLNSVTISVTAKLLQVFDLCVILTVSMST